MKAYNLNPGLKEMPLYVTPVLTRKQNQPRGLYSCGTASQQVAHSCAHRRKICRSFPYCEAVNNYVRNLSGNARYEMIIRVVNEIFITLGLTPF